MNALEKNAVVISAILAKLLDIGISNEIVADTGFEVEEGLRSTIEPCMNWLANEGLVKWANTAHSLGGYAWIGPVLTSRGIAIMGARLDFDGQEVTVAEYVNEPRNLSGNYSAIGDFLGSALGGFTKSISS